jgi:hypothetical protein
MFAYSVHLSDWSGRIGQYHHQGSWTRLPEQENDTVLLFHDAKETFVGDRNIFISNWPTWV